MLGFKDHMPRLLSLRLLRRDLHALDYWGYLLARLLGLSPLFAKIRKGELRR